MTSTTKLRINVKALDTIELSIMPKVVERPTKAKTDTLFLFKLSNKS